MHDSETRALRRTALLLLVVSVVRWGWPVSSGQPDIAEVTDSLLAASQEGLADAEHRSRPLEKGERIDPNLATAQELDRLPGVGAVTAQAIVAERELSGPFRDAGDLSRVRGIGPATIAKFEPYIVVSRSGQASSPRRQPASSSSRPRRPPPGAAIDINRATVQDLVSLPGIGPALAARIVDSRKEQMFGSIEDLVRVRGIGAATLERLRPLVTAGGGRR